MAEPSRATITAVAARAGVSIASVSRVMNGNTRVDPDIVTRVHAAAEELGYRASPAARSLVLGETGTVAVLVPDLANPAFSSILRGVSRAAAGSGYRMLVADSAEDDAAEEALALDLRHRCDALILCSPRMPDVQLVRLLERVGPAAVLNRDPGGTVPYVAIDYAAGVRQLADHLYGLGHRRFLFLEGNPRSATNTERLGALRRFVDAYPDITLQLLACGVSFEHGHAAAPAVLASTATAVLAFNDLVATGLAAELRERGVRVPEELSVTGFDDTPLAGYASPPLTTATAPSERLGELGWERISALLSGGPRPDDERLVPSLRVRGSTGPAPRGGRRAGAATIHRGGQSDG